MPKLQTKRDPASPIDQLAAAIRRTARAAKFCVTGRLSAVDPGLEVKGLGRVPLPLKRGTSKPLLAACQLAPYGKGAETLLDTRVRKTYELDPRDFNLSDKWAAAVAEATQTAAVSLGLPGDRLEAHLYKLLVYEKGGFFLPHRDSEKLDRMVASLIVVLPNPFEGGGLIVRHGGTEQKLTFQEAAAGKEACFAAFYADCEHEVERVNSGVRIALAYNLVLKPGKAADTAKSTTPADRLAEAINSWVILQPANPLVFALEHHYTQHGLSLDLLKGADRELAESVLSAAAKADCLAHLAQVSRHLSQFADDGSLGYGYSRYSYRPPRRHAIEIGETYEDDLEAAEWADPDGKKQPWGPIALETSAIVSSIPIDDWKPTSEEFEGYTGNAGNTLDRWYHRSAVVVWRRDRHFEVIAGSGPAHSIPLFYSMVTKLTKTPKKRIEAARGDCIAFARAIVNRWPRRSQGHWNSRDVEASPVNGFPDRLLRLRDRDTIAAFLMKLAEADEVSPLDSFVPDACREFGWAAFAPELKHLLAARMDRWGRRIGMPLRDVEWLAAFCCEPSTSSEKANLADELCAIAVERFCDPRRPEAANYAPGSHRPVTVAEKSLPSLLKALAASGRSEDLTRVIRYVRELPNDFGLDDCQVPALKSLIPWSRERFGSVLPPLEAWLGAVRAQLEHATAEKPTPPSDWARPAEVECRCEYCGRLRAFLADAKHEIVRIPAREDRRSHLESTISRHQCDVESALERKGSPYSLVLTKTTGSFERAVKRFDQDCRLLRELPVA